VRDRPDDPACRVRIPAGSALATSSTVSRQWQRAGVTLHHILDPRTGHPVEPVWRTVSVAAATCARANTLSTAALVRGHRALPWLRALGATARLVTASGEVVSLGGRAPGPGGAAMPGGHPDVADA
jgi:thiamine biosynthesis lipoprotein